MSAWIVSKGHIDCLVQAMVTEGLASFAEADELGRMLWQECANSIAYRYEDGKGDLPPGTVDDYRFVGVEASLDDAIVCEQAKCYRYQSCEHPGWEKSRAQALIVKLLDVVIARNKTSREFDARVEDAPWGITDIHEAIAS